MVFIYIHKINQI